MGVFHTICNFLSILGKRFKDAGLEDICIKWNKLGTGSTNGVFEGKMYNRAILVHKYVYEALMRILWSQFLTQLVWDEDESIQSFFEDITHLPEELCQEQFEKLLKCTGFDNVINL
jgi:hypothetical protein